MRRALVPVLGLIVLTGIAAASLALAPTGEPAGAIDLTGEWTVATEGDVTLECTAAVTQTNTVLDAELSCPGFFLTPLEGEFDPQTRELSLHPDYSSDGGFGIAVQLTGSVSEDGNKVEGDWEWGSGSVTGTFHAVRGAEPSAVPDLNGAWIIEVGIVDPTVCPGTIQQDQTNVQLEIQCEGLADMALSGEIDNRQLVLTGEPDVVLVGSVSPDGLAFGAAFSDNASSGGDLRSITGLRDLPSTFGGDVSGDWHVTLTGWLLGDCDVAVNQTGTAIFAAFDCGPVGAWSMSGSVDPTTSAFALTGKAGVERDYALKVRGIVAEDGESFSGTFAAANHRPGSGGFGGTLEGEKLDGLPSFMDITGVYNVLLISQLGERVPCELNIEQTQDILIANANCAGVGQGTLNGYFAPLTGAFAVTGNVGNVGLSLEGTGTSSALQGDWTASRRFVNGCFQTDANQDCHQDFLRVPGDGNCDGRTDSLDAALALQVSAGFIRVGDIPCSSNVFDLRHQCCPVVVNALDAAIILQLSAGLFGRLAG